MSDWPVGEIGDFFLDFVVENHRTCHPTVMASTTRMEDMVYSPEYPSIRLISQDLLKKYILYAKTNIHPTLDNVDQDKIAKMCLISIMSEY